MMEDRSNLFLIEGTPEDILAVDYSQFNTAVNSP